MAGRSQRHASTSMGIVTMEWTFANMKSYQTILLNMTKSSITARYVERSYESRIGPRGIRMVYNSVLNICIIGDTLGIPTVSLSRNKQTHSYLHS